MLARSGALGTNILGTIPLGAPSEYIQFDASIADSLIFEDEPVLFAAFTYERIIGKSTQIGVLVTT